MPLLPHERRYYESPPHEEIMELMERRFDEIRKELEDIKGQLRGSR